MWTTPAFRLTAAALLGCLLCAPAALAAGGEQTPLNLPSSAPARTAAADGAGSSVGSGLVRTIVGLAVVLGVIYGLHWVLKQVRASKASGASGAGLTPVASLPLGPNRSLHLVRAGEEVVLVGAGESGVTPIRTYTAAEARSLGLLDGSGDGGGPPATGGGTGLGADLPAAGPLGWLRRLQARTVIR